MNLKIKYMSTLVIERETNKDLIIKSINKFRLENKDNWYQIDINYMSNRYLMKAFNTYIQIFKDVNNNTINNGMCDISVSEFKSFLTNNIK